MKASETAYKLIRHFEGLRLNKYLCPGGMWTIGYGHNLGPNPSRLTRITKDQAESMLSADVAVREDQVNRLDLDLEQHEFDAIIDFVFNVGVGTFQRSTLLRLIRMGAKEEAADQFERYRIAGGVVQPGLVKRRAAEEAVFRGEGLSI